MRKVFKKSKEVQLEIIKKEIEKRKKKERKKEKEEGGLKEKEIIQEINKKYIIKKIRKKKEKIIIIGRSREDKKKYFIKINPKEKNMKEVYEKIRKIESEKIINKIEYIEKERYEIIIYEYIEGENLYNYIKKRKIGYEEIKEIIKQIIEGIYELHKRNIIHCDLKLENILINKEKKIKIIDYDISKYSKREYISKKICGTKNYIAPESYDIKLYSKKSDIWSLGVIIYILLTKEYPYIDNKIMESMNMIIREKIYKNINYEKIKEKYDKKIYELVKKLLEYKCDKRLTIEEIMEYEI